MEHPAGCDVVVGKRRLVRARLPLLLSMAALLLLAVVATRGRSGIPHGTGLVGRPPAPRSDGITRTVNPKAVTGPFGIAAGATVGLIVLLVLVGLLGFVLLGAAFLASLRFHRRRRGERRFAGEPIMLDEVAAPGATEILLRGAITAAGRLRGHEGGPPADAVQAAWVALEVAASEVGTPRRAERTSTEFTADVLTAHAVDAQALATLLRVYHRVRFGPSSGVTDADAADALAALDRIVADLAEGGRSRAAGKPVGTSRPS
jgi:hypothetical protein